MNEVQRAKVQHMVEALEQATPHLPVHTDWHFEAIEAGKALLEQPEQEPAFYWDMDVFFVRPERARFLGLDVDAMQALYTTPPAQPAVDLRFLKQVVAVAIAGLFEHYKDDVLRVFTLDELQAVVDLSDALRPQQVEDIYKRAWEMLTTPQAQPAVPEGWKLVPVELTDEMRKATDHAESVDEAWKAMLAAAPTQGVLK